MNETMLTALYCIIDDFINALVSTADGQKMMASWKAKRGPQRQLSLSEVLTLNITPPIKAFAKHDKTNAYSL